MIQGEKMKRTHELDLPGYRPQNTSRPFLFILIAMLFVSLTYPDSSFGQKSSRAEEKSPAVAFTLALGGTTGIIAMGFISDRTSTRTSLAATGIVLGPVLGYAYLEEAGLGLKYAAARALILGGSAAASYLICYYSDCGIGFFRENGGEFGISLTVLLVGVTAASLHNIVDTFSVNRRVKDHRWRLALSPTYFPDTKTPGLSTRWYF